MTQSTGKISSTWNRALVDPSTQRKRSLDHLEVSFAASIRHRFHQLARSGKSAHRTGEKSGFVILDALWATRQLPLSYVRVSGNPTGTSFVRSVKAGDASMRSRSWG